MRLIKSRPGMAQTSNSDSQTTADVEETSLPISLVLWGTIETREGGPNIKIFAVGTDGDPAGVPPKCQGESEEEYMDSSPDLDEIVKEVDNCYCQLLDRDTNLRGRISTKWSGVHVDGRQHATINQWM